MSVGAYAGDLSAAEAWNLLKENESAVLVDVRTVPEWQFVGVPDLSSLGKRTLFVAWQEYPTMARNGAFLTQLREAAVPAAGPVLFICRSGARSRAAAIAATDAGFDGCFNVAGGFEGDLDDSRRRGRASGWKVAGLPWVQE